MKRLTITIALISVLAMAASAFGGGGFYHGDFLPLAQYTNTEIPGEITGGYGIGVGRDGDRHGGFGTIITSESEEELLGAFGGVISGRQFRLGPVTLSANVWTGIGYIAPAIVDVPGDVGFLLEANAEAGVAVLPWIQVSVYAGMQVMGGFDPAVLLSQAVYTPVTGVRLSWGAF